MVARVALLAVLTALSVSAPAAHAQTIVGEQPLDGGGLELTIETPAFQAPTKVQVFLPAGYDADPNRRWPVTYYLHGAQGDQTRFKAWFGDLIADFPSILVAPDGGQFGFYSDWHNGGRGGPPMYETFHVEQLVPLIDQRFRTIGRREGRAVIGESMGGYGVMGYAARHPDVFAAAASLSGLLDNEYLPAATLMSASPPAQGGQPNAIYGSRAEQEVRWRGRNPTELADNLRDVDLQVRTFEGAPNPVAEGVDPSSAVGCSTEHAVYQTTTTFHRRLEALDIPHLWKNYGAGCHTIPVFRKELTDSLPGLEAVFADPRPAPKRFTYRSIEPGFDVWGWRVDADPARALEFLRFKAGRDGVFLVGSGSTTVTTPPWYRGLDKVDVGGTPTAPDADGRLRFVVDLGPPHTTQQYTDGASRTFERRGLSLAPHAVVRITKLERVTRGLRVCAHAIGGTLPDARITAGGRSVRARIGARARCRVMRIRRRVSTVTVRGRDRFGHPVRSEVTA